MTIGLLVVFVTVILKSVWMLFPNLQAEVYDFMIIKMTARWYACVLGKLEGGARVLDVGIGTGTALVRNKAELERKNIVVVGIDHEASYIKKASAIVDEAGLSKRVRLNCTSIYDPKLRMVFTGSARFDAAYFSGSLTLMPDPAA